MTFNKKTEAYVREHVRKILHNLSESKTEVLGGGGTGGRYPKELMELFGGKTVPDLLSRTDPDKLMKQLKVAPTSGDNDIQKLSNLLRTGVSGRPEMKRVYGNSINKEDGKGRSGLYVPVREISMASGRLFLRELVLAAVSANYLNLDGHVRVEIGEGGVLVYPVKSTSERWGS